MFYEKGGLEGFFINSLFAYEKGGGYKIGALG